MGTPPTFSIRVLIPACHDCTLHTIAGPGKPDGAAFRPQLLRWVGVGAGQPSLRLACASGGGNRVRRSSRREDDRRVSQRKGESRAGVEGRRTPRAVAVLAIGRVGD